MSWAVTIGIAAINAASLTALVVVTVRRLGR